MVRVAYGYAESDSRDCYQRVAGKNRRHYVDFTSPTASASTVVEDVAEVN